MGNKRIQREILVLWYALYHGTHYIMVHIIMEKEYTCSQVIMKRQIQK